MKSTLLHLPITQDWSPPPKSTWHEPSWGSPSLTSIDDWSSVLENSWRGTGGYMRYSSGTSNSSGRSSGSSSSKGSSKGSKSKSGKGSKSSKSSKSDGPLPEGWSTGGYQWHHSGSEPSGDEWKGSRWSGGRRLRSNNGKGGRSEDSRKLVWPFSLRWGGSADSSSSDKWGAATTTNAPTICETHKPTSSPTRCEEGRKWWYDPQSMKCSNYPNNYGFVEYDHLQACCREAFGYGDCYYKDYCNPFVPVPDPTEYPTESPTNNPTSSPMATTSTSSTTIATDTTTVATTQPPPSTSTSSTSTTTSEFANIISNIVTLIMCVVNISYYMFFSKILADETTTQGTSTSTTVGTVSSPLRYCEIVAHVYLY